MATTLGSMSSGTVSSSRSQARATAVGLSTRYAGQQRRRCGRGRRRTHRRRRRPRGRRRGARRPGRRRRGRRRRRRCDGRASGRLMTDVLRGLRHAASAFRSSPADHPRRGPVWVPDGVLDSWSRPSVRAPNPRGNCPIRWPPSHLSAWRRRGTAPGPRPCTATARCPPRSAGPRSRGSDQRVAELLGVLETPVVVGVHLGVLGSSLSVRNSADQVVARPGMGVDRLHQVACTCSGIACRKKRM